MTKKIKGLNKIGNFISNLYHSNPCCVYIRAVRLDFTYLYSNAITFQLYRIFSDFQYLKNSMKNTNEKHEIAYSNFNFRYFGISCHLVPAGSSQRCLTVPGYPSHSLLISFAQPIELPRLANRRKRADSAARSRRDFINCCNFSQCAEMKKKTEKKKNKNLPRKKRLNSNEKPNIFSIKKRTIKINQSITRKLNIKWKRE